MKSILCLLLFIVRAFADGGYVPRTGTLAPVEIPGQTAILAHHDGQETLTVWNTVKTDSAELAWVLPLPAAPSLIQQTDPRPIRALQSATAPEVELADFRSFWMILVPVLYLTVLILLWKHEYFPVRLALYVPIILIFFPGGYGGMDGGPGAALADVKVLAAQMTGNYETTVIKGSSAEAVGEWLKAREFPALAGDQLDAVREYIAKGWVFLCAKLPPSAAGTTAAHPLTVKFPSQKVIYPMRLTRSAGTVHVDLFLFSDNDLYGDASRRMTCMTPRSGLVALRSGGVASVQRALEPVVYPSLESPAGAAKTDALLLAMQQARFTGYYAGTFGPGSDWADVEFTIVENPPPPRFATRGALFTGALAPGTFVAGVALIVFAALYKERAKAGKPPPRRWLLCLILLLPPVAGAVRACFPEAFTSQKLRIVEPSELANTDSVRENARALFSEWVDSLNAQTPASPPP